ANLTVVGNQLYGVANLNGNNGCSTPGPYGCGAIFKYDPSTGSVTGIHDFANGADGVHPVASMVFVDGSVYGSSGQAIFSIDPTTDAFAVQYSFSPSTGIGPYGALTPVGSS